MIRYFLIFILLASSVFAASYVDSLKGTSQIFDTFLGSSESTANADTFNYGGTTGKVTGWSNTDAFYGAFLVGADCSTMVASHLALGQQLDSIRFRFYQYNTPGNDNGPTISFVRASSNWREGTLNGTAGGDTVVSSKYKGTGTSWSGQTPSGIWNGSFTTQTDSTWEGYGTDFVRVATDPKMQVFGVRHFYGNITDHWLDSSAVGSEDISLLLIDDTNTMVSYGAYLERASIRTSEYSTDANLQPCFLFYFSDPPVQDSTIVCVKVVLPKGTSSSAQQARVRMMFDSTATDSIIVFADTTTWDTLYWCLDSLAGDTIVFTTKHDFNASDSFFVKQGYAPQYQNCDSVFLWHEDFTTPAGTFFGDGTIGGNYFVTRPVSVVDSADRSTRDTLDGAMAWINFKFESPEKTFVREYSNAAETDSGWVWSITGGFTTSQDGNGFRYNASDDSMFCFVYRTWDFDTAYAEGMLVEPSGTVDTTRMEDMYFFYDTTGSVDCLYVGYEDKKTIATHGNDQVGLMVSIDYGRNWAYRGIIIDSLAGGDTSSTSSPVMWMQNGEYYVVCESKNGSYVLNGTPVGTGAGVMRMFKGASLYSMTQVLWYSSDGDDQRVPFHPYLASDTSQQISMEHWKDGNNHYLCYSSDEGLTVIKIDSSGLEHDSLWTRVAHLSGIAGELVWGSSTDVYRVRTTQGQVVKYHGVWYVIDQESSINGDVDQDSIKQMWVSPLLQWDTTGNPFRLDYYTKNLDGATGYLYADFNDVFTIQSEPYSERASVGIVSVDSFQTDFVVDIRYRSPYPSAYLGPVFGLGNKAVTSIYGTSDVNYEYTTLADGWHFKPTEPQTQYELLAPNIQPTSAARTNLAYWAIPRPTNSVTSWHDFSMGIRTDSVFFGFDGEREAQLFASDSAETDYKRISISAGSYLTTGRFSGVEIDQISVSKFIPGGVSAIATDQLHREFVTNNQSVGIRRQYREPASFIRSRIR